MQASIRGPRRVPHLHLSGWMWARRRGPERAERVEGDLLFSLCHHERT